jgi:hypothetical protein
VDAEVPSKRAAADSPEAGVATKHAKAGAIPGHVPAVTVKQEDPAPAHGKYGVPPDPDAEIQMISGRPFWFYINDKGEEVTVVSSFLC